MPSKNGKYKENKDDTLDKIGLEFGNKPPQAPEIEAAVLGAILIEPSCLDQALQDLTVNSFYDPRHKLIFETISKMAVERLPIDAVTVSNRLKADGHLDEVGGAEAVWSLSERVGAAAHVEYYSKILRQKNIQRDLITVSYEIIRKSFDDKIDVDDLATDAVSKVFDAIQSNIKKEVQIIEGLVNEAIDDLQKNNNGGARKSVPTGFPKLDGITMGWQPSDLIILAARPSVGKTAFALNMMRNAAVDFHKPVAIFSLEMSAIQLVKRLLTSESGLSADKIKGRDKLEDWEWEQLEYKTRSLSKSPIYIDDTPGMSISEFRTKAKNLVVNKGVTLIIIDYLQLMSGPTELRGMREQEVANVSRTLKQTAKELNVPIIALSQLSRASVQRDAGKGKPQLSDLRESGSIEQDADMVLFIHRPDAIGMSLDPEEKDKAQLIIAKHRNGETGEIDLVFKGEQVRFMEVDEALDVNASKEVPSRMNEVYDDAGMPPSGEF